jgi:hypothetical protein
VAVRKGDDGGDVDLADVALAWSGRLRRRSSECGGWECEGVEKYEVTVLDRSPLVQGESDDDMWGP